MEKENKDIFETTKKFNTGIKLYMFQTGSIKTKLKFIKMNQSDEPYEIPVQTDFFVSLIPTISTSSPV